ncbi:MAG TPA: XdhC/CoxI family protein [Azospirillum sp.]|nr:XdhC/CoxI family protein [Azospirillum sp.]
MTDATRTAVPTYADIAVLTAKGMPFVVATVVRTVAATAAKAGAKAVVTADGTIHGWIGGGCAQGAVRRAAKLCLADGKARLISVVPADEIEEAKRQAGLLQPGREYHQSHCPSGGTLDIFLEPMLPRPTIAVAGASPVALALLDLAPRIGFAVTLVGNAEGPAGLPAEVGTAASFAELPPAAERWVVIATQGRGDLEQLKAALLAGEGRVALIASRAKWAALRGWLAEEGVPADLIDRVKAPAGLDIGGVTPEEIALSILAEIVQQRRRGVRQAPEAAAAGRSGDAVPSISADEFVDRFDVPVAVPGGVVQGVPWNVRVYAVFAGAAVLATFALLLLGR